METQLNIDLGMTAAREIYFYPRWFTRFEYSETGIPGTVEIIRQREAASEI